MNMIRWGIGEFRRNIVTKEYLEVSIQEAWGTVSWNYALYRYIKNLHIKCTYISTVYTLNVFYTSVSFLCGLN